MNMPPSQLQHMDANHVAEKITRRIEIAKVARNLQDCLAFASFKSINGWEARTLSSIEPEITEKLARRKRPYPEDLNSSDSSTTLSEDILGHPSQPLISNSAQSYAESRKRLRASSSSRLERGALHTGWEQNNGMTQSSPLLGPPETLDAPYPSLQDSPMFDAPSASEDEDQDVGVPMMREPPSSILSSSPPRTPPPARRNLANTKQAGADLLLYLANSPRTPAVHVQHISSTSKGHPSTPPHQHANLPSSFMQTPGNLGLFNGALQTPGNFNLAEFCNVTPSPAQAQFSRHETPALGRTPQRSAWRSLNFDALVPPSPSDQRKTSRGLALQLGDALERQ
ncbi:hypothetical protein LTR70_001905 [Exophiala xenobiotica]|uniref:Uncharacterized protein n=1 Tax=Lithohypha guttulata TaxID=1690604 RepID=A0ABR0KBS1_9EURO|nr:hypothetical protein LTR24_005093 [Lithohypha guttulata]KAK5326890.1 hypothetical protein LTR70_001905 [Exophiala xenobiotica]